MAELRVVRIAVHAGVAVHRHADLAALPGPLGQIIEIPRLAAVRYDGIAISPCDAAFLARLPRLRDSLRRRFRELVLRLFRNHQLDGRINGEIDFIARHARQIDVRRAMRMRRVHDDAIRIHFRRKLFDLLANQFGRDIRDMLHIAGDPHHLLIAAVQHKCRHRNGIQHAFANAHMELPMHAGGFVRGKFLCAPTDFQRSAHESLL